MNIFFNEKSLTESNDIIEPEYIVNFFRYNIENQSKFNFYASTEAIKQWIDYWYLDQHCKKSILLSIYEVTDVLASPNHHYYYYKHLYEIENINNTGIAAAADKILAGQSTAILNVPNSNYSQRKFIPIIKSSNNPNDEDQFISIPCFDSSGGKFKT